MNVWRKFLDWKFCYMRQRSSFSRISWMISEDSIWRHSFISILKFSWISIYPTYLTRILEQKSSYLVNISLYYNDRIVNIYYYSNRYKVYLLYGKIGKNVTLVDLVYSFSLFLSKFLQSIEYIESRFSFYFDFF